MLTAFSVWLHLLDICLTLPFSGLCWFLTPVVSTGLLILPRGLSPFLTFPSAAGVQPSAERGHVCLGILDSASQSCLHKHLIT